jgi:hypothetical protein
MTQAEYLERMPFLADWDPALRDGLLSALDDLNGVVIEGPDAHDQVGIISVRETDHAVKVVPKAYFLEWARRIGVPQMHLDAIEEPAHPGTLDVLIIAGPYELVIGVPVEVHASSRGSRANN